MSQSSGTERAINPIEIQGYLKGLDYPANKDAVIARARQSHAPESILDILMRLPNKEYSRPTDISSALGKLK